MFGPFLSFRGAIFYVKIFTGNLDMLGRIQDYKEIADIFTFQIFLKDGGTSICTITPLWDHCSYKFHAQANNFQVLALL